MSITRQEYGEWVKQASPASKSYRTIPAAFLVGGLICVLGQLIAEGFLWLGAERDTAFTLVSLCLIALAAILTGLNVFDNIAKFAGAGTLVPITGFSNAVVSPALEFKTEGLVLGLGAKMFVIAGPVIVYGTLASVCYGIILYLIQLF